MPAPTKAGTAQRRDACAGHRPDNARSPRRDRTDRLVRYRWYSLGSSSDTSSPTCSTRSATPCRDSAASGSYRLRSVWMADGSPHPPARPNGLETLSQLLLFAEPVAFIGCWQAGTATLFGDHASDKVVIDA